MKLRLFVFVACVYLALSSRERPWADARIVWESAVAVVDRGTLHLDYPGHPMFFINHAGKRYGLYPIGSVAVHIPAILLAKALSAIPGAPKAALRDFLPHAPASLFAAGATVLFFVLLMRLRVGERAALLMAFGFAFCTILAIYARYPYSEAPQTFFLLLVFERATTFRERPRVATAVGLGLAGGMLLNLKVLNIVPLLAVGVWLLVETLKIRPFPWKGVLAAAGTFAVGLLVTFWNNHLRTGSIFDTGYDNAVGHPVLSGSFVDGTFGLLFSPGKGLFFFSPLAVLGLFGLPTLYRERRAWFWLIVGIVLAIMVPNFKYRVWTGGWSWGPRLIVPIVPLLLLAGGLWCARWLGPARRWLKVGTLAGLAAVSFFVQVLGCAYYWEWHLKGIEPVIAPGDETLMRYFTTVFFPQFSAITGHAWMLKHQLFGGDWNADRPWAQVSDVLIDGRHWASIPPDLWLPEWLDKQPGWAWSMLALFLAGILWSAPGLARSLLRRRELPETIEMTTGTKVV